MNTVNRLKDEYFKNPAAVHVGVEIAYGLIENSDFEGAAEIISEMRSREPANLEVLQVQGIYFERIGDFPSAIQTYYAAIGILTGSEGEENYWMKLGNAYSQNHEGKSALEAYNKAQFLRPDLINNPEFLHGMSWAFRECGEQMKARALLEKAIVLNPDYLNAYLALGGINFWSGNLREAAQVLRKGIREIPNSPELWNNLGYCLLEEGTNLIEAEAAFSRALELNESYENAYQGRGLVKFNRNEFESAIGDFKNVIRLEPKNAEAIFHIGVCYGQLHEVRKAVLFFVKLIRLEPNSHRGWHSLGTSAFNLKKIRIACWALNRAIEADPGEPWTYVYLSDCLTLIWNFPEALRCLDDGIKLGTKDPRGQEKLREMKIEVEKYIKANNKGV